MVLLKLFDIFIPEKIIYPIITIIVSYILILIDKIVINKIIKNNKTKTKHIQRSQNTILELLKNLIKYIIITVAVLSILKLYGIDTTAIVTSIGALSVVVGLAFQDVLKDYLVGFSIIAESQFALGEIVKINDFKGEVIYLGLKTTKIKAPTGEVRIISNRNISEITNYSLGKTLATIDISVAYEEDNKKVEKVLSDLALELPNLVPEINDKVSLDGINELADSSVIYRMSTQVRERDMFLVKRKVNKEIKRVLDENNIKIPYPQIEVHNE